VREHVSRIPDQAARFAKNGFELSTHNLQFEVISERAGDVWDAAGFELWDGGHWLGFWKLERGDFVQGVAAMNAFKKDNGAAARKKLGLGPGFRGDDGSG